MSFLGFDAFGRLAPGQLSALGHTNTVLAAASATYAVAGQAAVFRTVQPGIAGVFAVTGNAALLGINCAGSAGGYSVTSNAATLPVLLSAAAGNYAVSGNPSAFTASSCRPQAFTRFPETPRHSARRYRLPWAHSPSPALARTIPAISKRGFRARSIPTTGAAAPFRAKHGRRQRRHRTHGQLRRSRPNLGRLPSFTPIPGRLNNAASCHGRLSPRRQRL